MMISIGDKGGNEDDDEGEDEDDDEGEDCVLSEVARREGHRRYPGT